MEFTAANILLIIGGAGSFVTAVVLAFQKYRTATIKDTAAERKEELAAIRKEQAWVNEQKSEVARNWENQFNALSADVKELRQSHVECREENASLRMELRACQVDNAELVVRVQLLEKRL